MGKLFKNISIAKFGLGFRRTAAQPLDDSCVVDNANARDSIDTWKVDNISTLYKGLFTVIADTCKPFIFRGNNGATSISSSSWVGLVTDGELDDVKDELEASIEEAKSMIDNFQVGQDVANMTTLYGLKYPLEPTGRAHFVISASKYYISIANDAYKMSGVHNTGISGGDLTVIDITDGSLKNKYITSNEVRDTYADYPANYYAEDIAINVDGTETTCKLYLVLTDKVGSTENEKVVGFFGVYDDDGTLKGRLLQVNSSSQDIEFNVLDVSGIGTDTQDDIDDYVLLQVNSYLRNGETNKLNATGYPAVKTTVLSWTEWKMSVGLEWE